MRCILRPENIYVPEALARAYKLHVHDFFFLLSVHLEVLPPTPPPPNTKKAGYATASDDNINRPKYS